MKQLSPTISRLFCPLNKGFECLSFSLVDYRNNYFMSDNINKILEFYNGFENRNQLIQWMKDRPKGVANIHEVEGDKDIIVVIPTADINGKYAKECRNNIFKGLHIVFVESGRGDFYFNYAHNCNVGIKKAIEYNPKWIVVSNDDMVKIDDSYILRRNLLKLDNKIVKTVFTTQSSRHQYHSYKTGIGKRRKFLGYIGILIHYLIHKALRKFLIMNKLFVKFNVRWYLVPRSELLSRIFFKRVNRYIMTSSLSILSSVWCLQVNGNVFNECYINGVEDWELSISLTRDKNRYTFINYKIGDLIGGTLSTGSTRMFRDVVNLVYFDENVHTKNILLKL